MARAAAMLLALSTRNPFYLLLTIAVAIKSTAASAHNAAPTSQSTIDTTHYALRTTQSRAQGLLLRTVIVLAFAVALLKGLSYHIGATVLFSLPDSLPVMGGPITAEGLAAAGLDGLSILTVLAVFTAFSAGADYYAMLRSVPPFMHQVALVTSIAITFVPQTITRFGEIREAQALRGHRVRRVGDLVPLVMPLFGGRHGALHEPRRSDGSPWLQPRLGSAHRMSPVSIQIGLIFGLGLVLVGSTLFAFAPDMPWLAWLLIAGGLALLFLTLRAVGTGTEAQPLPPHHLARPRHAPRHSIAGHNRRHTHIQVHRALPPHLRSLSSASPCPTSTPS